MTDADAPTVAYVDLSSSGVVYDLGDDHPINPVKGELAAALLGAYGLLEHPRLTMHSAPPAPEEAITRVHSPVYVDAVRRMSSEPGAGDTPEAALWGLAAGGDTPAFVGMHEASLQISGAGVLGVELLLDGAADFVFTPGGLHHAFSKRANGFCIYNDAAVAIQAALDAGVERVAYIDIDVHHGDGVEEIFWQEPRVLTCSVHENGRTLFPGTGWIADRGGAGAFKSSVNVPLPALSGDEPYLRAITEVVAPAVREFEPGLVVSQMGVDPHHRDPLAHLEVTLPGLRAAHAAVEDIVLATPTGRWLSMAGGGYNIDLAPRMWVLLLAQMLRAEPDDALPEEWLERAAAHSDSPLTTSLRADAPSAAPADAREAADRRANRTVDMAVEELVGG